MWNHSAFTDIITGVWGALYKRSFFDFDIFNIDEDAWLADDIWISGYLHKKGIKRRIIRMPMTNPLADMAHYSHKVEGLELESHDRPNNNNLINKFFVKPEEKGGI